MYIWGGGWNEADTGAGNEALTIGVSPRWKAFSSWQSSDYDFHRTKFQLHDGLDCSGYMGWLLYNTVRTPDCSGYVFSAARMASRLSDLHLGTLVRDDRWLPGDLCSMPGHVWLCLGTCSDGSVLLIHSSPPGVRICGTSSKKAVTNSTNDSCDNRNTPGPQFADTQAVLLARRIMSDCYPDWYVRYPDCAVPVDYLTSSEKLRWHPYIFPDLDKWIRLSATEVTDALFP